MIMTAFSLYHDRFGEVHAYQTREGIRRAVFSEKPQKEKKKKQNKQKRSCSCTLFLDENVRVKIL